MANAVMSMLRLPKQTIEERAMDLNLQAEAVREATIAWNAIKSLEENEGWLELGKLATTMIAAIRAQIVDGTLEEIEDARGQIKALQWFVQSPSLAQAHLISIGQQQEALSAEMDDFIQNGAQET